MQKDRVYTIVHQYFYHAIYAILNIENRNTTIVTRKFVERAFLQKISDEDRAFVETMHPNYIKKCITIAIKECGFEDHAGGARGNKVFKRSTPMLPY